MSFTLIVACVKHCVIMIHVRIIGKKLSLYYDIDTFFSMEIEIFTLMLTTQYQIMLNNNSTRNMM